MYDIKSGYMGKIKRDQLDRLKALMGGREIKIVRSPYYWDNGWKINKKFLRAAIVVKGIVAAVAVQELWCFINTDRQDELLDEMDQSILLIRSHYQQDNYEQVALEKAHLIFLLKEFFEPINPSNYTNIMWTKLAEKVLVKWQ